MARRLALVVAAGLAGVTAAVVVPAALASVDLDYFRARVLPGSQGVQLTWHTLNEFGTVGFELYRSTSEFEHGLRIDPGPGPIPGCGGCNSGEYYTYTDAIVWGGPYYYWLVDVMSGGNRRYYLMDPPRPVVLPTATPTAPAPGPTLQPPPAQATDTPTEPAGSVTSGAPQATRVTPAGSPTAVGTTATRLAAATTVAPTRSSSATPGSATSGPLPSSTAPGGDQPTATVRSVRSTPAAAASGTAAIPATPREATPERPKASPPATGGAILPASTPADGLSGATKVAQAATAAASPTRRSFASPPGSDRAGLLKGEGLFLIVVAVIGLALLGGAAWRTLRAAPTAPEAALPSRDRAGAAAAGSGADRAGSDRAG